MTRANAKWSLITAKHSRMRAERKRKASWARINDSNLASLHKRNLFKDYTGQNMNELFAIQSLGGGYGGV